METVDLAGSWSLRNATNVFSVPALVPGDTHSALFQAGKIPDPYWADNELKVQFLAREDWIWEKEFKVASSLLEEEIVYLEVEALDTLASLFLNDQLIGRSRNAFVRHRFDVKAALRAGANRIRVEISSPEKAVEREAKSLPYSIPHTMNPVQSMHRNLLRKVQCHSGWDWGPCLMVSGIESIRLVGVSPVRIESVQIVQKHAPARAGKPGPISLEVVCEVFAARAVRTEAFVQIGDQRVASPVSLPAGMSTFKHSLEIDRPKLWWPAGHGEQPLYSVLVRVGNAEVRQRIGLRTIEVVNEQDQDGASLWFRINGRPVFAKGANWIPVDALPQRASRDRLDDLLSSAAAANMNMIRVWGGGRYESEDFYDLCDEKGLLVWQDFMFSCALYPATPDFLANVRDEVQWQVRRLRSRTCLALWCGNNENVGALNWFPESKKNRDRYLVDYDRLNEGVIGATVRELDPEHIFWPSSPCGGPGDYSDCWHDDTRGDMHFWSVWHEGKPFEHYLKIRPRFCSEFGFQSFPSFSGTRRYASPDQRNVSSPVMEHHQKNEGGNARIVETLMRYFRYPEGFENFLYLSQVQQGLAIRTAVEHFRRLRPTCMGAIYWQLNDTWPVASWSSLEYDGKWKVLHYLARRFFAPLLVTGLKTDDGKVEIWADCDQPAPGRFEAKVSVRTVDFTGKALKAIRFNSKIDSSGAKRVRSFTLEELGISDPSRCFVFIELTSAGRTVSNELFLVPYKKCVLEKAKIKCHVDKSQVNGSFNVTLASDVPAFFVTLDRDDIDGEFSDNVITLFPNSKRMLRFAAKGKAPKLEAFRRKLVVRHLRGTFS